MKNNKLFKRSSFLIVSALLLTMSCQDEDRFTSQDSQDVTEEALTDSYFQDTDDMASVALQSDNATDGGRIASGGRDITIQDERFCAGAVITIESTDGSTPDVPKGVITVDFGTTGCKDSRDNTRTGKIIFTYNGRRFRPESTVVTTVENYTVNGVKLEGTRTLTNVATSTSDAPKFNVMLDNGKATFEDNTVAERESNITWSWDRNGTPLNFADDKLIIDQSSTAEGKTRGGRSYSMSLTEQLEYKRFCGIAVSGIKRFVIDGEKEIIIDYGDGECDKEITVTINGVTRNVRVRN